MRNLILEKDVNDFDLVIIQYGITKAMKLTNRTMLKRKLHYEKSKDVDNFDLVIIHKE